MKAKKVLYSRLIPKENGGNAKIKIELEVEDKENAIEVFEAAKEFIEKAERIIEKPKIEDNLPF